MVFFDGPCRQIPGETAGDIRLADGVAVNQNLSFPEFNRLSFGGEDPFQQHDMAAGKAHGHHVKRLGRGEKISQGETKIHIPVLVRIRGTPY